MEASEDAGSEQDHVSSLSVPELPPTVFPAHWDTL